MIHHFPLSLDTNLQTRLEETVPRIAELLNSEPDAWTAKSGNDEELVEDLAADRIWRSVADELGLLYLSEELTDAEWAAWKTRATDSADAEWDILVVDPIDGSSEWNRSGWRHSPVVTAAMVLRVSRMNGIRSGTVRAATIGALWQGITYGIAGTRLTAMEWENPATRSAISVSQAKRSLSIEDAMIAAYSPKAQHARIVRPLFDVAPYVHNLGGMPYSLRVVHGESERSYAASIEPVPCAIWEHVGPVLASLGGAATGRLDGEPIVLDPFIRQTSVVAANEVLIGQIVAACKNRTPADAPLHVTPLAQVSD